jgi:hypothetical protein
LGITTLADPPRHTLEQRIGVLGAYIPLGWVSDVVVWLRTR